MMFSHGASCNIENAPLFIFSTISHLCALCLAIDLITKVDFNWIAGKAHKVTKKSDKNSGGRTEDGRRDEKEGLRMEEIDCNVGKEVCGAYDYLQVTLSSLEPHFRQFNLKDICTQRNIWLAPII